MAPVLAVLILQPDIGMTAVVGAVFGIQLFVAGLTWFWVLALIAVAALGFWQAYLWLPHFADRVNDFFDPGSLGYQIERALRAVAEGGLFGRGPGEGVQKWHLPDAHADFIFAATAEEFGIVACLALVALFAFLILRGLWRVQRDQRPLRPARRRRPDRRVRPAGAHQHGRQPQPDPDQGHDAARSSAMAARRCWRWPSPWACCWR